MEKKENQTEKTCYSAEELQFFKELILKKREEAIKSLELLNEAVAGSENDASDTAPTFKTLEEGSNVLSKEENSRLAARQQKFIKDLDAALIRIENKTYGICRVTGKLIPKERLMIVPHASRHHDDRGQDAGKEKAIIRLHPPFLQASPLLACFFIVPAGRHECVNSLMC